MERKLLEQTITNNETVWRKSHLTKLKSRATAFMAFAILLFFSNSALAQTTYLTNYAAGSGNPGGVRTQADFGNTGASVILAGSAAANGWSSVYALPFSFNYYGTAVTHLKASGNGVITFDTTATAIPADANTSLPAAASNIPNQSILGFWDAFTGAAPTGSNDAVWAGVEGSSPNRQVWIKYHSYEYGNSGTGNVASFAYWAIVLEEGTNKVYVVDMHYASNGANLTSTIGVQNNSTTAVEYGNSAIGIGSGGSSVADNSYYEFTPVLLVNDNAGIVSIDAPASPLSTGAQNVDVTLKNYGLNTLTSATINWTVNGVAQTAYSYTGTLAADATTSVTLGSYNFAAGTSNIVAWTTSPNGNSDNDTSNDSAAVSLCTSLSGNKTIGGVGADYATPAAAAADLSSCGVSGPVTFTVAAGTYTGEFTIGAISGASATNTITFDGTSAATTTFTYDGANTQNSTVHLDGADYVTFQNLTIANTESASYGWGVHLSNGADNNTIDNCIINVNTTSTSSSFAGVISSNSNTSTSSYGNNANNTMVSNTAVNGGYYGVRFNGSSSSSLSAGNSVSNCTFNEIRYYHLYFIYQDAPSALSNTCNWRSGVTSGYGIYSNNSRHANVQGNFINGAYTYGIYFFGHNAAAQLPTLRGTIANNMVIAKNFGDGIYLSNSDMVDIYHNSVTAENDQALWINSSSDDYNVRNNIFSISGNSTYTVDLDAAPDVLTDVLNYNIYNNTGTGSIAQVVGTNYATLALWQAADVGQNLNSLQGDPIFTSATDLHVIGALANDVGDNSVGITTDIDGDARPATGSTTVDIGADEYTAASCSPPSGTSAFMITNNSAMLTWTTGGASNWTVQYDTATFVPGTGTIVAASNDTIALTGLMAQTSYDVYVKDSCSATSVSPWSGPYTFTTLCNPALAPYTESFDGLALTSPYTALPACWDAQVGPDFWDVTNDVTNNGHTYLPNIGDHTTGTGNYMWIDASGDITANEMVTGLIDMSSLTAPYAGFWFASDNTTNATNHTISLDAWDGTAWVNVATESGNFTGWVEVGGTIPTGVPSTTKFRIYAIADVGTTSSTYYQNDLGVDDFFVIETPSCLSVTGVGSALTSSTSADVFWTSVSASFQVQYDTSGFTPGTGSFMVVTNDTASLTGLMANTSYDFYVRAICAPGDTSAWAGPSSFFTGYCTPGPSSVDGIGITNVTMGGINNTTGAEPGNYGDYSSLVAYAAAGDSLTIDITLSTGYTYNLWVWVDWNNDLDFTDAGEEFYLGNSLSTNPTTYNSGIAIPVTTGVGNYRIRIGGADTGLGSTSPSDPCYTGSWGAFEDYSLTIQSQVDLPITFDDLSVNYNPISFGGAVDSIKVDPTDPTNMVLRQDKPAGAQPWAGTTLGGSGLANAVPFAAGSTTMNARIWSPDAGTPVLLKVEDVTDPTISVETFAYTTQAGTWETLNFDFSNQAPGTSPIDLTKTYDKISVFCDFLNTAAGKTFYVDDVQFGVFLSQVDLPITFEDPFVNYNPVSFGGAIDSIKVDPTDPTNMVLRQDKPTGAQPWAGTTIGGSGLANPVPFAFLSTYMNARVWSPDSNTPVLLKVENAANGALSVETYAYTTTASAWETLTFDFSNSPAGTPPINLTTTYDKVSIFCDFLNTAAGKTFYVDDIQFGLPPCTFATAPYTQSFEGSSWTIPASACSYTDGIDECWSRIPNGYSPMSWVMRSGSTCSGNTGPNSANTGSNYAYLETSQGGTDAELWMELLDISSLNNAELKFFYHMYGATIGTLYTEISTDNGSTWVTIDSISGAQQASSSDAWIQRFIDISSYTGIVNIRFRGSYGGSFTGDISIDDISVDNVAPSCPITDVPVGIGATSCGSNPVTLSATGNTLPTQGYFWMRSADSAIVGMDDIYTTPPVTATTDYLLGIGTINTAIAKQHVGPQTNIAPSGHGNFSNGQFFHADDFFYLDSVVVNTTDSLSFAVRISEQTATGPGTELLRSDTISVIGSGDHQVEVGLAIAPGSYFINIDFYGGPGAMFRATGGAVYPYTIANVVSIDSTNAFFAPARYYYTFDWVVSDVCYSTFNVVTATSGAIPSTVFPYAEDFNTGLPCNWTTDNIAGGADWTNVADLNGSSLNGSNFMFIDDDAAGPATITEASLVSPVFNTQGYDTLFMSFDHYYRTTVNSVGYIEVYDGTTWVAVDSFSTTTGGWSGPVSQSYDVTAYQNTDLQVRFRYDDGGDYGWYWAVDNFAIDGLQTPCENVVVDILTDTWGSETTWSIADTATGTVYASGGPYPNTIIAHYIDSVCLPLGTFFEFRLNDSYGDGLFDGTNTGTYDVDIICSWGANNVISGSGAFPYGGPAGTAASWDSTVFEVTCAQPGCFDPIIVSDSVNCATLYVDWMSDTTATTRIEYGIAGFTPGTGTILNSISAPYILTGLTNGTTYDYYLVDSCSNGNLSDTVWGTQFATGPLPIAAFGKSLVPPSGRLDTVQYAFNAAPSQNETLQVWNYGDGSPLDSGLIKTHDYTANGTFDVILYVYNSCGIDSDTQQVVISTIGLEENGINNFALYPNPNKGRFTLNGTLDVGGEIQIQVLTMTGALVHSQKINTGQQIDVDIDLTGEASGVYQVRIISAKGVTVKPFVIQD